MELPVRADSTAVEKDNLIKYLVYISKSDIPPGRAAKVNWPFSNQSDHLRNDHLVIKLFLLVNLFKENCIPKSWHFMYLLDKRK